MAKTQNIINFCETYLNAGSFTDYCHNGLQVEGVAEVTKIVTGVSLSQKLINEAVKRKAQMIMVHHGIFTRAFGSLPQVKGVIRNRLKLLLENNINLVGYHLPLDAHPQIGNNISILKLLKMKKADELAMDKYGVIGYIGEYEKAMPLESFLSLIKSRVSSNVYVIAAGPKKIKRVGVVSGGSSSDFADALKYHIDAYICGDIREEVVRAVEESNLNLINAGHYNTETFGIKNLGELIAKKFKVRVEFVDVPCDV